MQSLNKWLMDGVAMLVLVTVVRANDEGEKAPCGEKNLKAAKKYFDEQ